MCSWAARLLLRVHTHPGFQVWAPRLLIWVRRDLGFKCVLRLLILCSQSRGQEGRGARGHSFC